MADYPELKDVTSRPGLPLYTAVRDRVMAAIESGRFQPGQQLPSTKALSKEMSVSLVTVHRAMQELVNNGVLRRGQGRGTYVHEDFGRHKRRGLGQRFGLVFHAESSLADAYHGQIFEGVRQAANEDGVDLVLLRFGEDWRNECHGYLYVNPFQEQLAKPPRMNRKPGEDSRTPIMVVGASFSVPGVSSVDTDNAGLARDAVNHLHSLGHRRLAYVGAQGKVSNDRDRHLGFVHRCEELDVELPSEAIVRSPGWRLDADGAAQLDRLLARADRPTAIFAAGYYFALDVYSAAARAGLNIPGDLSILGVDDPPSAAHLSPPLTTFRQPLIELGRLAADGLLDLIKDGGAHRRITLSAQLIDRDSCAPSRTRSASAKE